MTKGSDKAKNDLLNSMRVSKQGSTDAGSGKTSATAKSAGKTSSAPAKKATRKTSASKAAAKKPVATKKQPAKKAGSGNYSTREGRAGLIADAFESGQRIWPD